ncbi:MAG: DUF1287 domain-containing protein [Methylocystaceae bacterium]
MIKSRLVPTLIIILAGIYLLTAYLSLIGMLPTRVADNLPLSFPGNLSPSVVAEKPAAELTLADRLVLGARAEVKRGTCYDASYQIIAYPGGDVKPEVGACSDVIIRAYRSAGIDLQVLVHEDMEKNFNLYPHKWGLKTTDPNIDHRRVPNLACYFARHGVTLTKQVEGHLKEWQWGDVVVWRFKDGRTHIGIISDRKNADGVPAIIDNSGIARERPYLQTPGWTIIGHYRYPAKQQHNP